MVVKGEGKKEAREARLLFPLSLSARILCHSERFSEESLYSYPELRLISTYYFSYPELRFTITLGKLLSPINYSSGRPDLIFRIVLNSRGISSFAKF